MKCFWLSLNTSKDISCSNNGIWREARFWEKKNRPLLPLCQQPTCVLHKPMCIHPTKLILWEYKRKPNTCTSKAFCLDYKKFHSAAEGVGRLAHPYARMPTKKNKQKKKKQTNNNPTICIFLMQNLCLTNQEIYSIILSPYQITSLIIYHLWTVSY